MRLAPLLALLGELDLLADTLLIVTSDHGEELFEHGRPIHQQPYQEVAQVPLVVHGPGIPAGARVAAWTELVDLMPTVLDALGLPIPPHVQGESLLPLLRGERPATACAHVDGRMQGFPDPYPSAIACDIDGVPWTYVDVVTRAAAEQEEGGGHGPYGLRGPGELYRLDGDPNQQTNLALAEPALAARLGRELIDWYGRNEAAGNRLGEASAPVPQPTPAERARLRALGYAE
jgi:arylsulfatase A-like enzyme